jgi:hypothetical protein
MMRRDCRCGSTASSKTAEKRQLVCSGSGCVNMRDCGSRWPPTTSVLHERLLACRKAGAARALQVHPRIEQQVVQG